MSDTGPHKTSPLSAAFLYISNSLKLSGSITLKRKKKSSPNWVSLIQNVWDWHCFRFGICFRFWNICIYMRYLAMRNLSKHKIHLCFGYTLSTLPTGNFIHYFLMYLCFSFNTSHEVRCEIFHLGCHVGTEKVLDFGTGFRIFELGILNLYILYYLYSTTYNDLFNVVKVLFQSCMC